MSACPGRRRPTRQRSSPKPWDAWPAKRPGRSTYPRENIADAGHARYPGAGAPLLEQLDPEEHLTSPLVRRAAVHLQKHLAAPAEGLPPDDEDLARLIREMAVRAGEAESGPAALEVEWLQLELSRVDRAILAAREAGGGDVGALAKERADLRVRLEDAVGRAVNG